MVRCPDGEGLVVQRASRKKLQELIDVWPEADSLKDAGKKAGLGTDQRSLRRYRRQAEREFGITLDAHNDKFSTENEIECPSTLDIKAARQHKDFVITSATNNSPTVKPFLEALEQFVAAQDGQLLVVPVRYRNPNAMHRTEGCKWDERIYPYALQNDLNVGRSLMISATRLQATAVNPLVGLGPASGVKSAIYGHPQLAMEMVATPSSELPKMMHTTGSVSRPRYSSSKAGGQAKFNHSISAVYVQIVGSKFFAIQLSWDGSGFYYYDEYWTEKGKETAPDAAGVVFGDDHIYWERKEVTRARRRLCELVRPKIHVRHDLHDHHSQNHHHTPIQRIKIAQAGDHLVEKELDKAVRYLNAEGGRDNWIVRSNHHDAIEKWLNRFRPDQDPHNAPFYFDMMSRVVNSDKSALELYLEERLTVPFKFIDGNDKAVIAGISVCNHGDKGVNGTRGSLRGFAKTSYKTVTGHSHTPGIEKGAWAVGCGTDKMDYKEGLSSWMLCDCIIYANGKRALIPYINGKFRRD